jgi:tetrahydromethanopterin S-methyltransferase subunit F
LDRIGEVRESVARIEATCKPCRQKIETLAEDVRGQRGLNTRMSEIDTLVHGHILRNAKMLAGLVTLISAAVAALVAAVVGFLLRG